MAGWAIVERMLMLESLGRGCFRSRRRIVLLEQNLGVLAVLSWALSHVTEASGDGQLAHGIERPGLSGR